MHVAITGASSGIGEAIAREYARAGAKLSLVARRRDLLDRIVADLGDGHHVSTADLGDPDRAEAWLAEAERALGPIDVLVNNAGMQIVAATETIEVADFETEIRLDLTTPLRLMHLALRGMLERGRGTVVNITSSAAFSWLPGMVHYNAAKAGLSAASESLRAELRGRGVNVLTVYPGPVDTAMARVGYEGYKPTLSARMLPAGTAPVLARRVRRAVEKGATRIVYPRFYHLTRLFEWSIRVLTNRFTPPARRLPAPAEKSSKTA
jgi:short-subunit dehydrogenase